MRRLLELAQSRGIEPRTDRFTFSELCQRNPNGKRFDMRLPVMLSGQPERWRDGAPAVEGEPEWAALHAAVDKCVRPVLDALRVEEPTIHTQVRIGANPVLDYLCRSLFISIDTPLCLV